jgi:hypothetical protein
MKPSTYIGEEEKGRAPLFRIEKIVSKWDEDGMGPVQGKCQIVCMLHNLHFRVQTVNGFSDYAE